MTGETTSDAAVAEGQSSPWRGATTAPVLFDECLVPSRSLSKSGFFWVMAAAATTSTIIGTYLWLIGAWPVIGFGGLDVLLLYLAFRASYHHAHLSEHVRLTADELDIERTWPNGRRQVWRLEPHWTRLETEGSDGEISKLRVVCRGRPVVLGSFLSGVERAGFATRLREALRRRTLPES